MAEPHGNFVRRIGVVFNPISRIVYGLLHVWPNSVRFDADIAVGRPVLPGPTPHVAEHSPVQLTQKLSIEDITPARLGPTLSVADIGLFGFVQFMSQRDVGRDEPVPFLVGERRVRVIVRLEWRIQHDDPVRRPIGLAASRIRPARPCVAVRHRDLILGLPDSQGASYDRGAKWPCAPL